MRNLIVWDYMWLKAGTYYRFTHEFIMYGTKGKRKRRFDAAQTDIWRVRCINYTDVKNKLHQAQKPIELIQRMLLNDTDKGLLSLIRLWAVAQHVLLACKKGGDLLE